MPNDLEIKTLVDRLAEQDKSALRPLWAAVGADLLGICSAILQDDRAAEAALEEVFVKIWHNAAGFAGSGYPVGVWLRVIARNHALDLRRATEAAGAVYAPDGPDLTLPEDKLGDALSMLSRAHGQLVARAYVYGEGYDTLSQRMGLRKSQLRPALRASLIRLREAMTQ